jgi:heptosyltransferase-2
MRALVVKIGAIGDVVMALPLAAEFKRRFPQGHLTWVCGGTAAPLVRATGLVDRVVEADEGRLYRGGIFSRLAEAARICLAVTGRRYERVNGAYRDRRYRWLVAGALSSCVHLGGDDRGHSLIPGRDHAEEHIRIFLGEDGASPLRVRYPRLAGLPAVPTAFADALRAGGAWIALAPGGAVNVVREEGLRRWPIERYRELASDLARRGHRLVLTGSASDAWVRPHFEGLSVLDLIGQTDLLQTVAVYSRCLGLVTHDSGPLHLAKLAGCSIIGLFGPTTPSEKLRAGAGVRVLWGGEGLACRPCYDGREYAACQSAICMSSISAAEVADAVGPALKEGPEVTQ